MGKDLRLKEPKFFDRLRKGYKIDLIFYGLPALIILCYSETWLSDLMLGWANDTMIYKFITDHPITHIILVSGAIILPFCGKYINGQESTKSGSEPLRVLISSAFDNSVNAKIERLRKIWEAKIVSPIDILNSTANPNLQLPILCENLLVIFRDLNKNKKIKLTTILCVNNSFVEFNFHSDFNPKVTIEEIRHKSIATKCLLSRKPILVSEVKDTSTDFYKGTSDIKSIYCYPICKSKEVNFILSFSSSEAHALKTEYEELYGEIISEFENRFLLEWYWNNILKSLK